MPKPSATWPRVVRPLLVALLTLATLAGFAATQARAKTVRFRGFRVSVPASWPVYDLSRHPATCVRFNRHAVYLGTPSRTQRCPALAIGRTEAILVSPRSAANAQAAPSGGSALELQRQRVTVSATWNRHANVIRAALGLRSLAVRPLATVTRAAKRPTARTAASGGTFTGQGFDACSAPSETTMAAWTGTYRALNVYIGGANRGCSQPNLTPTWTSDESAAGWHLIPTYVGLQSPTSSCGCATISPSQASSQGATAAQDAVAQAAALELGPGTPIYFDMEGYSDTSSSTSAVLAFLSAWTSTLHSSGYLSGVYSSTGSGIRDLVRASGTSFVEPDDLWIADWNGVATTNDAAVPATLWANHQRIHQYRGDHTETHGGVTLDVDSDFLDGAVASAKEPLADGTFIQVVGQSQIYRIAGGAPTLVTDWSGFGGVQPVTFISAEQFASLRAVPAGGTFLLSTTGGLYRVAGGSPLPVPNPSIFGSGIPSITVDAWDFQNETNPAAHLRATPAPGTIVQGLPSQRFWKFKNGGRMSVPATRNVVHVDDAALLAFKVLPCVVPSLKHQRIASVRITLRNASCRLGKVSRPRHVRRGHILRVIRQSPKAKAVRRTNFAVRVTLG